MPGIARKKVACPVCGYPLKEPGVEGEREVCAYCNTNLKTTITQDISSAAPLFIILIVGLVIGIFAKGK